MAAATDSPNTLDATEAVNRVLDFFPPEQQGQIRLTQAGAQKGITCQRLVHALAAGWFRATRSS